MKRSISCCSRKSKQHPTIQHKKKIKKCIKAVIESNLPMHIIVASFWIKCRLLQKLPTQTPPVQEVVIVAAFECKFPFARCASLNLTTATTVVMAHCNDGKKFSSWLWWKGLIMIMIIIKISLRQPRKECGIIKGGCRKVHRCKVWWLATWCVASTLNFVKFFIALGAEAEHFWS